MTGQWILATGGAGYIGSHVVAELLAAGYRVVILDNFENSEPAVLDRINALGHGRAMLVTGDVRNRRTVECVFRMFKISAVIHLAGKKAVGEFGGGSASILRGQSRRGTHSPPGDAREQRQQTRFLFLGDGLWRPRAPADRRNGTNGTDQSLWSHQVDDRGDDRGHGDRAFRDVGNFVTLLQPSWCASKRSVGRGTTRHSEQPFSLYCPDCRRATPRGTGFRR